MSYPKLRRARIQTGASQQVMAQLLGLHSKNAYGLKERGERKFCVEEAIALARCFGMSVETLFISPDDTQNDYEKFYWSARNACDAERSAIEYGG